MHEEAVQRRLLQYTNATIYIRRVMDNKLTKALDRLSPTPSNESDGNHNVAECVKVDHDLFNNNLPVPRDLNRLLGIVIILMIGSVW